MIRIGLLGATKIAPRAIITPAQGRGMTIAAVAARAGRAAEFAKLHGIPVSYERYEDLIESPSVDVVYHALPPSLRRDLTLRALAHGKHVICEKPFALNSDEAVEMVAAARASGKMLLEAYHFRFHPVFQEFFGVLSNPEFGRVRRIRGIFDYPHKDLNDFRNDKRLGGGALMDLGVYPLYMSRMIAGAEPTVGCATARRNSTGADLSIAAELSFSGDITAHISASIDPGCKPLASISAESDTSFVELINPIQPLYGYSLRWRLPQREGSLEAVDHRTTYDFQFDHFLRVLNGQEKPLTGYDDSIRQMAAVDAIYATASA